MTTGRLIICPTPIGNLRDITLRALDALRDADVVCAEDTRVTAKLLSSYDIEKRIERLDEAVLGQRAAGVVDRILTGETIVYCSDAGMPGVSDPGARLIAAAHKAGASVEVLPGASAAVCAYVAAGTDDARYFFGGFFPRKATEQRAVLEGLRALDAALVFYESPHRLIAALEAVAEIFPLRRVTVCRELTKVHEEVLGGSAEEVLASFRDRSESEVGIKGEIAFVIHGAGVEEAQAQEASAAEAAASMAQKMRAEGVSTKDLVKRLRDEFGISRNEAYELALGDAGAE